MIYAVSKEKYESYLYALSSVKQLVQVAKMLVSRPEWKEVFAAEELNKNVRELEKVSRMIGSFQWKKSAAFTGDAMDILRDYIIGATLWDITEFGRIAAQITGKREQLLFLYEFVGKVDMEISVLSFRESLPYYCVPEFVKENSIQMEQVYHPLLRHPVSNNFTLDKGCIITGANATGKSTFIKAVAVNAILAQTIQTCAAEKFCMPHMRVLTSMSVRDDILAGESYYIREAKNLKRIVAAADENTPVLCMIDEILRGTNTKERLAAAYAVLSYLAEKNCITVAATHDMELLERLQDVYACYYFKSEFKNHEILFDYQIHAGANVNQNAIQLLKYLGFPDEILSLAHEWI